MFNVAWLNQTSLDASPHFSPNGLIPPAITGLHNGDVIRAWMQNGIVNVVGDNTRPVLTNLANPFWPYITNVADNGYAGLTVMPRWVRLADTFPPPIADSSRRPLPFIITAIRLTVLC